MIFYPVTGLADTALYTAKKIIELAIKADYLFDR